MILPDTNVVSEVIRMAPSPAVRRWLDEQTAETLYLSSVTVAELLFGVEVLASGRRKENLTQAVDAIIEMFKGRVLAFDLSAARSHAALAIRARKAGRGFPTPDGYIAAIAASRKFAVASRDTAAFSAAGLAVIDPWRHP